MKEFSYSYSCQGGGLKHSCLTSSINNENTNTKIFSMSPINYVECRLGATFKHTERQIDNEIL